MKRSRIRKTIISSDERDLPDDVRAEIEKNPEYRELQDRTDLVRRVVALKRYESPASGSRERCVVMVRKRIEWMQENEREKSPESDFSAQPAFSLRYGLAAAVAAVLAVQAFISGQSPSNSPSLMKTGVVSDSNTVKENETFQNQYNPLPPGPNYQDMGYLFEQSVSHPPNTSYDIAFTNPAIMEVEFLR